MPAIAAIAEAKAYFAQIAPRADGISTEVDSDIQFRDCGGNLESIRCPICDADLPTDWWHDQLDEAWKPGFDLQPITTSCGHVVDSLNALTYYFDQGFSRFIVNAMNPKIGMPLSEGQTAQFEVILGCPVKVIYRHL